MVPDDTDHARSDKDALIRDLRVRIGLLESELEHLRHEHASLKASLSHDIAVLARRYGEPHRAPAGMRNVDGVIFGGWDRQDTGAAAPEGADRTPRSA